MIADANVTKRIDSEWTTIAFLLNYNKSRILGPNVIVSEDEAPDEIFNLALVLACASLDEVLDQLLLEHKFSVSGSNHPMLGKKMEASKANMQWIDFNKVRRAVDARNDLAHGSKLASKYECISHVNAIADELRGWAVIK